MTKKYLLILSPLLLPLVYLFLHLAPLFSPLFLAYLVYLRINQSSKRKTSPFKKRNTLFILASLFLFSFSLLFLKLESSFFNNFLQPNLTSRPYFTTRLQGRIHSSSPFSFPLYLSQATDSVNLIKLDLTYQSDSLQFLGIEENSLQNTLLLSSYYNSQDAYLSLILSPTSAEFSSPDSLLLSLHFLPLTAGQSSITILPTSKIYKSSQNIHFSRPQAFSLSLYPSLPSSEKSEALDTPLLSLAQNNDLHPSSSLPLRVSLSDLIYRLDKRLLSLFLL